MTFHLYTKRLLNLYFTTNFMPSESGYLFQADGTNNSLSFHQNNSSLNLLELHATKHQHTLTMKLSPIKNYKQN